VSCSGGSTGIVWPAVEMNGGKGAPAVGGGKEVVEELQGDVAKLEVGSMRQRSLNVKG
jgi:hypothetical protein